MFNYLILSLEENVKLSPCNTRMRMWEWRYGSRHSYFLH